MSRPFLTAEWRNLRALSERAVDRRLTSPTVYRSAGVPLVWVLDPYNRTVMVHQLDAEPEMFNVRQELSGEPHLPGFRVPVARLFE